MINKKQKEIRFSSIVGYRIRYRSLRELKYHSKRVYEVEIRYTSRTTNKVLSDVAGYEESQE